MAKSTLYFTVNKNRLNYKDYRINVIWEIIVYCENNMKSKTTMCEQTADLTNVKARVKDSHKYSIKQQIG